MFKFRVKNIAVFTPILSLLLLALMLPTVLMPSTIKAQDVEVYALVQVPSLEKLASLKSSVISVFDFRNGYALIGCTLAQLDALKAEGYNVIQQCSGPEDQCVSQLADRLNSVEAFVMSAAAVPASFNYSFIDSNTSGGPDFYWIDIQGTGTNTGIHCDDCGVVVPIGFTFNFDGNSYNTIGISSNGYLTFGPNLWYFWNNCIPTGGGWDGPADAMYVFWDDLFSMCDGSDIYYETRQIFDKKVFIVQWVGNQFCCGCPQPTRLNFEAILFQGSNIILFQYNNMTDGIAAKGAAAVVGLENKDGTAGLQYSCHPGTQVITDGLAILFCPGSTRNCVYSAALSPQSQKQQKPGSSPSMPATTSAVITVRNMNIVPQQVSVGQPITISANMSNDGDQAGGYTATLKINGQMEQTKIGAVDGHSATPVSFTVFKSQPGTYTADIGGQKGTFTVLAAKTHSPSASSGTIAIIIMSVLILSTVVVLAFTFRRPA